MLSYEEALNELLQATTTLGIETVSLQDALNRTLATSISARLDHPPFPQSAMDGLLFRRPLMLNFQFRCLRWRSSPTGDGFWPSLQSRYRRAYSRQQLRSRPNREC